MFGAPSPGFNPFSKFRQRKPNTLTYLNLPTKDISQIDAKLTLNDAKQRKADSEPTLNRRYMTLNSANGKLRKKAQACQYCGRLSTLELRHFLPVQLGLSEKLELLAKIAQNLCTHVLVSPTPIFCENFAGAPPHNLRTISAHFSMPSHIFRTNFLGLVRTALRASFAQFSQAHDLFSKSDSVQAVNVSTLATPPPNPKHFRDNESDSKVTLGRRSQSDLKVPQK